MKRPYFILLLIYIFLYLSSENVFARNVRINIVGGEVHMNGKIIEGACSVSTESQDMHIDMGQYNTHSFERVGALSTTSMPFTLRLEGCKPEVSQGVGVVFSGMTDPKEPDVFLVSTVKGVPVGISGNTGFSGLGLLISDEAGNLMVPDTPPAWFQQKNGSEVELHYLARYRASSRNIYPGPLRSEVWFDITYP
jgi:type 1 fimbria pilin